MKKIFSYLVILFFMLSSFTACKKMDSTYKKFIVPGGITYTGKVKSPIAYTGRNRVKISWLRGADPSVIKARIFWNNYTDSVEINIPPAADTISYIIDSLPEKPYSFMIRTYDAKGNSSVPVEVLSAAYGEKYQASLLSRPLNAGILYTNGTTISIQWGGADISNGAYATEVKYADTLGNLRIHRFPVTETASVISDINAGIKFQYRTVYLPDSLSIDTFYTPFQENESYLLDKTDWRVIAFSTQHPGAENAVTNVIDGRPNTRWHTWVGYSQYPHYVTVDMGVERTITDFEIFRMTGDDRACNTFQLLISKDNITWTDLGVFNFNRLIDDGQFYHIPAGPQARYFKFVGLTGPQVYMVTGEISVYGL